MSEEYPGSHFYPGRQLRFPVMPSEYNRENPDFSLNAADYSEHYTDHDHYGDIFSSTQDKFADEPRGKTYLEETKITEIEEETQIYSETLTSPTLFGRSKKLGVKGVRLWNRIISADGADKSGMRDLTYTSIVNNAADAGMMIPLANILLFNSSVQDSKFNVAIYLLVTLAPYAIIAPLIGPLLDRIHSGRRIALTCTFFIRTILAIILVCKAQYVDDKLIFSPSWILYPCTLLMMLSSKSYTVLKAAIIPRVVPEQLDLVQVNSRINTFSTLAGTTLLGGTISFIFELIITRYVHIAGGFLWMSILCIAGGFLCLKLPIKIEGNKSEVPTILTEHFRHPNRSMDSHSVENSSPHGSSRKSSTKRAKQPLGLKVISCLTGVSTLKLVIGFLYLFMIFYPRSPLMQHLSSIEKIMIVAAGGGATGVGGFLGNILGAKIFLATPEKIVLVCSTLSFLAFGGASLGLYLGHRNLIYIVIAAFISATCANAAKVSLDSSIQSNLPHNARASAFGLSESILQIGWVIGAALGALLPPKPEIAFTVIAGIVFIGLMETISTYHQRPLILKRAARNSTLQSENQLGYNM